MPKLKDHNSKSPLKDLSIERLLTPEWIIPLALLAMLFGWGLFYALFGYDHQAPEYHDIPLEESVIKSGALPNQAFVAENKAAESTMPDYSVEQINQIESTILTTRTIQKKITETVPVKEVIPKEEQAIEEPKEKRVIESVELPAEPEVEIMEKVAYKPIMNTEIDVQKKAEAQKKIGAAPTKKVPDHPYQIALVIDDLGPSRHRSREVIDLPPPITLAFLPYAKGVDEMAEDARKKGHAVMVHMPMEPKKMDSNDPGSDALLSRHGRDVNEALFLSNIERVGGSIIGLNNHMGSRFTADATAFDPIARLIAQKKYIYLDSKTTPDSLAADLVRRYGGIAYERDIFIDHYDDDQHISRALSNIERIARKRGYVIAIGHPRVKTVAALKSWISGLDPKVYKLVSLDKINKDQ